MRHSSLIIIALEIKADGARRLARHRQLVCEHTADTIEASPERALALGGVNIERSASSFAEAWRAILAVGSVTKICALLRDDTDDTEQMRISQPFAGLLAPQELRAISREVYPIKDVKGDLRARLAE